MATNVATEQYKISERDEPRWKNSQSVLRFFTYAVIKISGNQVKEDRVLTGLWRNNLPARWSEREGKKSTREERQRNGEGRDARKFDTFPLETAESNRQIDLCFSINPSKPVRKPSRSRPKDESVHSSDIYLVGRETFSLLRATILLNIWNTFASSCIRRKWKFGRFSNTSNDVEIISL